MDFILPDWAPSAHPLIVHFPISLLLVGIVVHLVSFSGDKIRWASSAATFLYVLAGISAIAAFFSGKFGAEELSVAPELSSYVSSHADAGKLTAILIAILAVARLVQSKVSNDNARRWGNFAVLAFALFSAFQLWRTAERGAELVYRHGIGIAANTSPPSTPTQVATGVGEFFSSEGSNWIFEPRNPEAFTSEHITFHEGSASDLRSVGIFDSVHAIWMNNASVVFTLGPPVEKVIAEATVNTDGFEGEVKLVHHFQNTSNYDFLSIDRNTLQLGRLSNGSERIMEQKANSVSGLTKYQVVGDGTHFRGYANDALLVHGHTDALPPGPSGMLISGTGVILITHLSQSDLGSNK